MVTLRVYAPAGDFDFDRYSDVDKMVSGGVNPGSAHWFTNTGIAGATLFNYYVSGLPRSPLYFGSTIVLGNDEYGFAPDGAISGRVEGDRIVHWIDEFFSAGDDPKGLVERMFAEADRIIGNVGDDLLRGLGGDDTLAGGGGDDVLMGGEGADELRGGAGSDRFVYASPADLDPTPETIADFRHVEGDVVDLTRFDADPASPGLQLLSFIGQSAFGAEGAPEVRVQARDAGRNLLQFDLDGDGIGDATLRVRTETVLDGSDVLTGAFASPVEGHEFARGEDAVAPLFHGARLEQVELATVHLV